MIYFRNVKLVPILPEITKLSYHSVHEKFIALYLLRFNTESRPQYRIQSNAFDHISGIWLNAF